MGEMQTAGRMGVLFFVHIRGHWAHKDAIVVDPNFFPKCAVYGPGLYPLGPIHLDFDMCGLTR